MLQILGRISGLEEDVKNGKILLTKVEMEKRQLQERFTDLEKVKDINLYICVRVSDWKTYSKIRETIYFSIFMDAYI